MALQVLFSTAETMPASKNKNNICNCNNGSNSSLLSIISSRQRRPSRGRRRRARALIAVTVAAASILLSSSLYRMAGVSAAIPPSLQLNNVHSHHHYNNHEMTTNARRTHNQQQQQQSYNIMGGSNNGAKEAVEGGMSPLVRLGRNSAMTKVNHNNSSSQRRGSAAATTTILVVQPDSLHRNIAAQDRDLPSVTKVHPWPIPEDAMILQKQEQRLQQQQPLVSSEILRFNNNDDNVSDNGSYYPQQQQQVRQQQYSQQEQQQHQQHQELHVANYMPSPPQGAAYNDAASFRPQLLSETKPSSQLLLSSPIEDLDVISGKQIILRPRLSNTNDGDGGDSLESKIPPPPMGIHAAGAFSSSNSDDVEAQPIVYYYDPQSLIQSSSMVSQSSSSASSNGNEENADFDIIVPELTLPEIVYTKSGTPLTLEQVHAGGKNEVFLEITKPKEAANWKSSSSGGSGKTGAKRMSNRPWNAVQNKLLHLNQEGAGDDGASWHSQDQLIVLFTVATMAIMVGALSARRLRNQHILESCMHPDLNDDDDDDTDTLEDFHVIGSVTRSSGSRGGIRYDKKYDLDTGSSSRSAVSGFSAITGSGGVGKLKSSDFGALLGGGNYGTNGMNGGGSGGNLHWRGGDMEKFDV